MPMTHRLGSALGHPDQALQKKDETFTYLILIDQRLGVGGREPKECRALGMGVPQQTKGVRVDPESCQIGNGVLAHQGHGLRHDRPYLQGRQASSIVVHPDVSRKALG